MSYKQAIGDHARNFTPVVSSEQACFLVLPAMHSHTFGAESHRDHFCHYKEGSSLGVNLAQRRAEGRGSEKETRILEYCTTLIFSVVCLFTLTWVSITGNPKNPGWSSHDFLMIDVGSLVILMATAGTNSLNGCKKQE